MSIIGKPVTRLEDAPLLAGTGRFADDIAFADMLHMRIVRSPLAHGRVLSVDLAAARQAPGVVAAWSAADIAHLPPIEFREGPNAALAPYRQPVLAQERVRYVGEPVAAIFASDPYRAEDAAQLVAIEIDPLPPILDAVDATGEFAPGLGREAATEVKAYGDIAAAFAAAAEIVSLDLSIGRHSGVPLETRGAIARLDASRDVLQLYGAAKVPHRNRESLARMFGRSPAQVHLYEGHVGGGFGVRGEIYPEDVLVCAACLALGRPVKWIEDRREHLLAANHSRQQHHRVRAAIDGEGRVLAMEDEFFLDQGAYVRTHGARVLDMTSGMLPGPYRVPAFRSVGHFRLTNKTPAATYRAPGRFESSFVRERLMDAIAARLGLDPIELRRRNLIAASEMPFTRGMSALNDDVIYDSGDYPALVDKALTAFRWDETQRDLAARRAKGEAVGSGFAFFVEKSGLGPKDGVEVAIDGHGEVELVTGGASIGQGFETAMAQICAGTLGVDYRKVRVIHGQTERISHGIGAHASRATVMTGSATEIAARILRRKLIDAAAPLLQAPADALDIEDGVIRRRDDPAGASIGVGEVAKQNGGLIEAEGWFETPHMNYPYGCHLAVVRVDRETGAVDVERYCAAYDIGRAVNPMMVAGQISGGFAQGLGGTLAEEFVYDEAGQPLAATLADYTMPGACETPTVELLLLEDSPSPLNALGIKGAGEAGVNAVGATIAAAIDEAIGINGAITTLPATPPRILALMRQTK